jgi:hypothetical protein
MERALHRIVLAALATMWSASACTLLYPVDGLASGRPLEAGGGDNDGGSDGATDLLDALADQDLPDAGEAEAPAVCGPDAGGALVGEPGLIEPASDDLGIGDVQAFSYRAVGDGCLGSISLLVPAGNTAPSLDIGLYDSIDGAGSAPSRLLGSAVIQAPGSGWNTVTLAPAVAVTGGMTYWIGVLEPASDGGLKHVTVLDRAGLDAATASVAYVGAGLLSLPPTWPAQFKTFFDGPLSAYAQ